MKFDITGGLYTFDENSGRLDHPNGVNTSWFRWDGSTHLWVISEWAVDLVPALAKMIISKINEKNPSCDMQKCKRNEGEVKMLPLRGDGNMILCRHCFETEVLHRKMVLEWTDERLVPFWDDAKPYET